MVEIFPELLLRGSVNQDVLERADMIRERGMQGICLVGMGGSSIAGEVSRALLQGETEIPVISVRDYRLPQAVNREWTVLVVSYSGNTEETLSAFDDARRRGAEIFAVTTGGRLAELVHQDEIIRLSSGLQPRAALPHMFSLEYTLLRRLTGLPEVDLSDVAAHLKRAREAWRDGKPISPQSITSALIDKIPLFVGWRHLAPVAYRAKCQVNENAKAPALYSEIPEFDHNEIEASGRYSASRIVPIFLRSHLEDERVALRIRATTEVMREEGADIVEIPSLGHDSLTETLAAILFCDEVSVDLADRLGVDATIVRRIERLKRILAGEG